MSPPTKQQLKKGAHGYGLEPEDFKFLQPDNPNADRGNWDADASGQGYNSRFDDSEGWKRGNAGFTAEGGDGAVYNLMPDESRDRSLDHLIGLDDDATGMGSGNKLLGGGGPLTKGRTVGSGALSGPKAPKTGPRTNSRRG